MSLAVVETVSSGDQLANMGSTHIYTSIFHIYVLVNTHDSTYKSSGLKLTLRSTTLLYSQHLRRKTVGT